MKIFLCLIFTISFQFASAQSFYATPTAGTATTTSTLALAQNTMRKYLIIQNTGSNIISVKFGSVQSGTEGIWIVGGGSYEPIVAPANSIYMKATSGTSDYTIIQGN